MYVHTHTRAVYANALDSCFWTFVIATVNKNGKMKRNKEDEKKRRNESKLLFLSKYSSRLSYPMNGKQTENNAIDIVIMLTIKKKEL